MLLNCIESHLKYKPLEVWATWNASTKNFTRKSIEIMQYKCYASAKHATECRSINVRSIFFFVLLFLFARRSINRRGAEKMRFFNLDSIGYFCLVREYLMCLLVSFLCCFHVIFKLSSVRAWLYHINCVLFVPWAHENKRATYEVCCTVQCMQCIPVYHVLFRKKKIWLTMLFPPFDSDGIACTYQKHTWEHTADTKLRART